jgi:hypothetical protein
MVCVYKATTPADAEVVRHWLERNEVAAQVRGGLVELRGQIPMGTPQGPTVWVSERDSESARHALQLLRRPQLVHPQWTCSGCGELNAPSFGSCWSCQEDGPPGASSEA